MFLPNAREHALCKVEICARYGITGVPPLNEDIGSLTAMPATEAWQAIFHKDLAMMEKSDLVIANLTPFRGASADAGTLIEVGWFLGRGRPIFGYTNSATLFAKRSCQQVQAVSDPLPGLSVEGFGLPDNLMIPGAVQEGGGYPIVLPPDGQDRSFDALDMFEQCVEIAAWKLGLRAAPSWILAG